MSWSTEDKNEELVCCPKYVYQKWYQILNWSAHVYSGIKEKKNERKHILFDDMWFKICADIQEMKGETRKKVVFMQEICYQFAKNLFSPSTAKIVCNNQKQKNVTTIDFTWHSHNHAQT